MPKQPNTRDFQIGDRIISHGEYAGTLLEKYFPANNQVWKIKWDDGAEDSHVNESRLAYLNGGPDSGGQTIPRVAIAEALRQAADELPFLDRPKNMLVRQQDAAAWLRERADTIEKEG
jgi:hypothetical protein